jgi:hypothetical protein
MDRRLISTVVSVGALGLIALGTCRAKAADAIEPKRDIASHAPASALFKPAATERRRPRVAAQRAISEERGTPRMALVLGTGF